MTKTAYRILVSGQGWRHGRLVRGKHPYTKVEPTTMSWVAWNLDHTVESARLPGSGSFVWPGLHAVRTEALRLMAASNVSQVSIRTNQDRSIYVYRKDVYVNHDRHTTSGVLGYPR